MKPLLFVAIICLSVLQLPATAVQQPELPYYVVAGSFEKEENALRYAAQIHARNYPARTEYNSGRGLFYVYVSVNAEKTKAKDIVQRMRAKGGMFKDAWIFHGSFGPVTEVPPNDASVMTGHITRSSSPVIENDKNQGSITAGEAGASAIYASNSSVNSIVQPTHQGEHKAPVGEAFVFKLINRKTGEPVRGKVILTESEKETQRFKFVDAGHTAYVSEPKNSKSGMVIICDLVGFKYEKKGINYEGLVKDKVSEDEIEVPIELTPYRRRDYIDLHGISFYDSSALLKPESEGKLMELVHFMSSPRYKIRLHGHTSADISGPIRLPGKSNDLFHAAPENEHVHDDAKALTRYRAQTIKTFLVSHGIVEKRILTQGHGAMVDIFEEESANERIEVEILKD